MRAGRRRNKREVGRKENKKSIEMRETVCGDGIVCSYVCLLMLGVADY